MKRRELRDKKRIKQEKLEQKQLNRLEKQQNKRFVMSKENVLKVLVLIIGLATVLVLIFWFITKDNQYKIEGTAVQYYAGQAYLIEDGAALIRGLDETTLTDSTGTSSMSSIVIYQDEENKIILTQDMIYYDPRNNLFGKIDALTEIVYSSTGTVAISGNKEYQLNKGFLYDGDDYYIFLEDVVVNFNGYKVELTPFSYIEAIFQTHVMVFDYDTQYTMFETPETEVTVTAANGDYTLSLINDAMVNYNDEKTLLFTSPDLLDSLMK